ncbi:MAG TPA: preprotein translocase subunit YajC [Gammaproteobacteria bacterium]|nr:preprotein translocase subunit YajC [Gammaproteobacteria bacterium]
MNFFIQDAYAAGGPAPQGDSQFITIIIFVVLIGFFWLFLIRPQQKRQKEHQKMLSAISKGDEVVTNGGVLGRIKDLDEQFITLEVAPGVDQRIQRQAISAVMPKGTLKNHLK